jgi:hypothetical protein
MVSAWGFRVIMLSSAAIAKKPFRDRRKPIPGEPPREIERAMHGVQDPVRKTLDFPGTPVCGRAIPGAHAPEKAFLHSRLPD